MSNFWVNAMKIQFKGGNYSFDIQEGASLIEGLRAVANGLERLEEGDCEEISVEDIEKD